MTSFTSPVIRRGKKVDPVLKGVKKAQAEASGDWFIEYRFTDPSMNILKKRIKYRGDLNRIKDPKAKEAQAQHLVIVLTKMLEEGYHPLDEDSNTKMRNEVISIEMKEALGLYKNELATNGARSRTTQTYLSKLNPFAEALKLRKVNAIQSSHVSEFMKSQQLLKSWTPVTFNLCRTILNGFFNYLIRCNYITDNPIKSIPTQKTSEKSSAHRVFKDSHLSLIIEYLNSHDPFTALFVKAIYYTCIRPRELRQLKLNMIDMANNQITIPGTISKNKKTQIVAIDSAFKEELNKWIVPGQDQAYYLFSSGVNIIGPSPVGENTPYDHFKSCLEKLELLEYGYTLYSIKHTSNVQKYLAGWTVPEIMKANRHSSITETENYLRELSLFVDITTKSVPRL